MPLITATPTNGWTRLPVCVTGHLVQVSGDCPRWTVQGLSRGGSGSLSSEGTGERKATAEPSPLLAVRFASCSAAASLRSLPDFEPGGSKFRLSRSR